MPKGKPFRLNGVDYPSQRAAAASVGCSGDALRHHLRRGTLHKLGTGRKPGEPMPVRIRGVDYPSAKAAAAALGVTPGAIHWAIARGKEDRIGLGFGKPKGIIPASARQIVVGSRVFPSLRALSAWLGRGHNFVSSALAAGRHADVVAMVLAREMAQVAAAEVARRRAADDPDGCAANALPKPILFCGIRFADQASAARAFGLRPDTLSRAVRSGRLAQLEARVRAAAEGARDAA